MHRLISHRILFGRLLLCLVLALSTCSSDTTSTATERSIAFANFDDGVEISLVYGAFRSRTTRPIVARAANPEIAITVRSGPSPDVSRAFEIQNVSPRAELKITDVIFLNSENEDGCPFRDPKLLSCESALASIGRACTDDKGCEVGTLCRASACQANADLDDCTLPSYSHFPQNRTRLLFTYDVLPCRSMRFTVKENTDLKKIKVGILGAIENIEALDNLDDFALENDLDFYVFLGNVSPDFSDDGLNQLYQKLESLPLPVTMIAGDREAVIDGGGPFLRKFGPHQHVFNRKQVKFLTFYSATGSLGETGLQRIDSLFAQARRGAADIPFIVFTHTPPLDIDSGRDQGFRSRIEGARVLGILNRYDVDMLFTGNTALGGSEKLGELEVVLTGESESTSSSQRSLTILEIDTKGEITYKKAAF